MAPVPGYQAPPHSCDPAAKTAAVGQNKVVNELLFGVIPLASESTRGVCMTVQELHTCYCYIICLQT